MVVRAPPAFSISGRVVDHGDRYFVDNLGRPVIQPLFTAEELDAMGMQALAEQREQPSTPDSSIGDAHEFSGNESDYSFALLDMFGEGIDQVIERQGMIESTVASAGETSHCSIATVSIT